MEYLNDRLVMLSKVAHTRGLIDKSASASVDAYLLALLDQQEAALHEYDAQIEAKAYHVLRDDSRT